MTIEMINSAQQAALVAAGVFFLVGLLTGVWKYVQMHMHQKREHYYIGIAHRASLMYAFAALLLERFAAFSAWSEAVNFWAVVVSAVYFGLAIGTYVVHGMLKDTTNQLKAPYKLSSFSLPAILVVGFMATLIVAEIGGFLVLFTGLLKAFF
ncbi:MAG TPA: hypothetical protein VK099_03195 [Alcanivoracaceae bacterium]|nr:hypothetical protein [Alcanivoracaceae bacterium]